MGGGYGERRWQTGGAEDECVEAEQAVGDEQGRGAGAIKGGAEEGEEKGKTAEQSWLDRSMHIQGGARRTRGQDKRCATSAEREFQRTEQGSLLGRPPKPGPARGCGVQISSEKDARGQCGPEARGAESSPSPTRPTLWASNRTIDERTPSRIAGQGVRA